MEDHLSHISNQVVPDTVDAEDEDLSLAIISSTQKQVDVGAVTGHSMRDA